MKHWLHQVCSTTALAAFMIAPNAMANDDTTIEALKTKEHLIKVDDATGKVLEVREVTDSAAVVKGGTVDKNLPEETLIAASVTSTEVNPEDIKFSKKKKNTGRTDSSDVAWGYINYGHWYTFTPIVYSFYYYYNPAPIYYYTPRYTYYYYTPYYGNWGWY